MRTAWLGLLTIGLGCTRNAPAPVPPTPPTAAATSPEDQAEPTAATQPGTPDSTTPAGQLRRIHGCEVTVDESISLPNGVAVAYRYPRLEAAVATMTRGGVDVKAKLDRHRRECTAERSKLDEHDREWLESEGRSCDEIAAAKIFDDDQLSPECMDTALAYFDRGGTLVYHETLVLPCSTGFELFELRELGPKIAPQLILETRHAISGELTRGGWGHTRESTHLNFAVPLSRGGSPSLYPLLNIQLSYSEDSGVCSEGARGGVIVLEDGTLVHYSQESDDCEVDCLRGAELAQYMADHGIDDVEAVDDACEVPLISADIYTWVPEEGEWDGPEAILDPIDQMPATFDY